MCLCVKTEVSTVTSRQLPRLLKDKLNPILKLAVFSLKSSFIRIITAIQIIEGKIIK